MPTGHGIFYLFVFSFIFPFKDDKDSRQNKKQVKIYFVKFKEFFIKNGFE